VSDVENAVCDLIQSRAVRGLHKYGVTIERDDIDLLGWIQHLQEELADALVYLERIKKEVQDE